MLPLTFNAAAGSWSRKPGMEPPVLYQLHNAEVIYRFANLLTSISLHPSPSVALPPFVTVPLSTLMSADGPVREALVVVEIGCGGRADSSRPSWPEGIRAYVELSEGGVGSAPELTFAGRARRA